MTAVTDPDARTSTTAPLPDRSVVPPVWSRITDLVVERGEGSWLIDDRRRAVPRLHLGHRRHQHGARPPAGRGGDPGPGGEAAPRPAEHRLPRGRAPAVRAAAARAAGRSVVGVPVELGRRGRRGGREARAGRDRAAGDHRVPLRVPRPHGPGDVADRGQGRLPRRLRAAAGLRLPRVVPVLLSGVGRRARPVGVHLRLGGPARPAVPPARLPRQGGRGSSSSRSSARAATSSRRRRSCRGCARSPASTGSC